MVVNRTGLPNVPTDGDQFVERSLVDQVAGIVLAVPGDVRSERVGVERSVSQKLAKLLSFIEGWLGELAKFGDEILD